ncbi:MAG: PCRF domain-containing protein [Pseudomonadota bacterium]
MIPQEKLDKLIARYAAVETAMSETTDAEEIVRLSKEHAELKPIVEAASALTEGRAELEGLNEMAADREGDPEMAELARTEAQELKQKLPEFERALQVMLLPKDKADDSSVILEVRAGTGGDEAALFAGDLFRMYQRYASIQGWRVEIIQASESGVGGFKEVVANIAGEGVFARMKFESGVHRVQRVPETETQGRVHTSAATVAVLPEPEDVNIVIEDKDLRIDVFRASGPGGQSVNTTDSAVRITHIPTAIARARSAS